MKYIILEKYINIDPQDVEQKKKYLKDVEKILSISYGNIGGPVNISSYEELLEPKYFWKLNKRNGKIVALCIYKVSNGGRKISLCGCDGTPEGKERLYALLGEDVTQEARKTWGEFSGAIEHIYKDKLGATIIPNYVAKEILNKLGKDVISLNPDGVHYTRIINGNEVEKVMLGNVPQEDSLGKMFIQESRKIRVWDKTLTEAKEDKEKFKNWIADGVANSSLREQPQIVDILVNKFVELKPRIKSPYNDFYYWIKNSTFDDFWNYLTGLIQEINHKDEIKQKEKDGAELIYSDDTWKVYHITNYEASAKYGKGTKWCITGTKRWNDGTTGKETFQDYHDKNNVEFYFYLNKNGDKYALALYPNGKSYEIFNAEDVSCAYIPDAPKVEGLPDVSLKDDKKVLINALASDKIDDDIILNAIEELAYGKGEDDFDIIFALTSDEVSSIMNEKIPDSYLEYRAVARGEMTPDEYKSITGDTITDLDISNGYFWGGDLPEVEVDEDKFLTKKEACDSKNYQGHKYWYFFEDRTSWNPYELYWADDKVGLYNSLRQLMGFDDMYSFLEALADTLIYEVKEGKLELDKLSGSISKEYIDNLEESFIKEDVNQDISNVSNAFGTTKEPFLGPSYILPNGKFLKIRNADINISNNGSGDRGLIIHLDVQKWINKQQGKEEKYVDDIGLEEKCIRVNTDQLEHYIVLPKERPNDKQLKSLRDWIDFFYAKTSSDLVLVSYYGPTTTYFKGAVSEDIIEDIKNYYARGMFFENLKEYMDEVTIEKNGEDFPVFATDETYRLKNLLVKGDKAYRIYNDDETYYFQDAEGNKTHYEMLRLALRNGWLANSKLRDGNDDDLTSGTISPESYDEGYMVFIPFNYNKKLRYHTRLGDDGYYDCRVYPFGVMFVRSSDAYENGLFSSLGEPDKEIYYDEQYETTIVKSGNNTREFDVELELQGDPNIAVTTDVMNLRPKEDVKASRDAKIQKSKEVMKECGVPEKLWGKSGQELYFIVRDFMAGDYADNRFISKEDAKAIVKYLNIMNFSDVPKIEGKIEDKSLQEKIVKKGSKWQVQSEKGKNLGTYDTKKEAEDRLKQVHYFKHMNEAYFPGKNKRDDKNGYHILNDRGEIVKTFNTSSERSNYWYNLSTNEVCNLLWNTKGTPVVIKHRESPTYLYRGISDRSFSKNFDAVAGLFFGVDRDKVKGWGDVKKYLLSKDAKIYKDESSDEFCSSLYNKEYPELKKYFGMYFGDVDINRLNDFTRLTKEQQDIIENNVEKLAGEQFCWYDVWTWCLQLVARIELEKQGYDGARWEFEDAGNHTQYQIWNLDVIKSYDGKIESLQEDLQETDNEGTVLSKEQIEFFKNSKVRDEQGRLLVCYHGTSGRVFYIFDKNRFSTGSGDVDFGAGFYFTKSKDSAKSYANMGADEDHPAQIFNVYLNITNPLYIPTKEKDLIPMFKKLNIELNNKALEEINNSTTGVWSDYFKSLISTIYEDEYDAEQCFTNDLVKNGYDGVIFKDEIVAFEPNQIKSIDNKNPTNSNNINESEWTPDKINAREKENQDRIDALTEQDVLDWCKRDKVATGFAENGPSIIFTSGEVYNLNKYKYHMKGLLNLFKGKGGYRYGPTEPGDWDVMEQVLNKCEKDFGIVTTNLGMIPGLESKCKVVALKKPTERQYEKITDFLDIAYMKKKQVIIYLGEKGQQTYNFINDTSDDIIKKIKKAYAFGSLEESREDFFKNSVVRDAFYDGSISEDKLELVEGVSNEFDSIVKTELDVLNRWLDKYGFEVKLITDKETLDDIDWSSQYGSDSVGMFLGDIQDNASVFPIALNKKVISKLCKDKDDLIRGIKGTLCHEAGHGIYRFLEDVMDMPEDEEDCVEEFARYRDVSELFDILQEYMKQKESLKESIKCVDEDKHKDIIFKIDDTENINDDLTYVFVKVGIYGDNYYLPESLFVEYNNDTKEVILDTNRQCNKSILSKINYELNLDYDYVIKQLTEFIIDKKDSIERFNKAHKLLGEELQEVILSDGAFEDLSYIRDIDSDYIDVKELEDVTYKQLLGSDLVTPIGKLYHSTPISNLESIKQNGLRIDNKNLWSMSKSGRIYLALNPEESIDYVELAYQWGALDVEDVVLLEIPLSALDLNKLYIDTNEDENGYCVDGKLSLMSLEYRDNIPASNIKIVKTIKEEQDENLNESTGFPITVYTYQKPQVRELLENGETYIASYERANYSHYKDLSNLLGLNNCPIFGALSKGDLYTMLNSSGIDFEEENILHLEIPKENLHYMEYYDWTDYMDALDDAESFEEETGLSLQDLENLIKTQKSSIDYDECQVVFDRIEPQWYEDGKEEEEALNESKQDFEKFRKWCGNDELYNRFMKLRPRLANIRFTDGSKGDDIYFWMKNNTPKDLEDTLQDLEGTPTKKERNQLAKDGSIPLYNQDGWKVFKIETLEASQKYGRNTMWCISGQGGYDACSFWNGYEDCTYFYIDTKNNKKYALIWKKGDIYWTIYNELDEIIPYIPNAPRVEGLPDVSILPKELCQKIAKVLGINASDIIDIKSADNDPEIMDAFIDYDSRENYIVDTKDKTYYIINERGYEDITQEVEEFISENEL